MSRLKVVLSLPVALGLMLGVTAGVVAPIGAALGQSKAPAPKKALSPKVIITQMPTDRPSEELARTPIEGRITGAPKDARLAVYALGGGTYYVQPWANNPFVDYSHDGRFSSITHGGEEFVCMLVKPGYRPAATMTSVPKVGGDVLAIARAMPKR